MGITGGVIKSTIEHKSYHDKWTKDPALTLKFPEGQSSVDSKNPDYEKVKKFLVGAGFLAKGPATDEQVKLAIQKQQTALSNCHDASDKPFLTPTDASGAWDSKTMSAVLAFRTDRTLASNSKGDAKIRTAVSPGKSGDVPKAATSSATPTATYAAPAATTPAAAPTAPPVDRGTQLAAQDKTLTGPDGGQAEGLPDGFTSVRFYPNPKESDRPIGYLVGRDEITHVGKSGGGIHKTGHKNSDELLADLPLFVKTPQQLKDWVANRHLIRQQEFDNKKDLAPEVTAANKQVTDAAEKAGLHIAGPLPGTTDLAYASDQTYLMSKDRKVLYGKLDPKFTPQQVVAAVEAFGASKVAKEAADAQKSLVKVNSPV